MEPIRSLGKPQFDYCPEEHERKINKKDPSADPSTIISKDNVKTGLWATNKSGVNTERNSTE
ncbi:unnamed protein product, partial [Nesidiocoris tenuis]